MWKEGLFMMPQHLQLIDTYHEQQLNDRINALGEHFWGVTELEIDPNDLARGVLKVSRCTAAMQDGHVSLTWLNRLSALEQSTPAVDKAVDALMGLN